MNDIGGKADERGLEETRLFKVLSPGTVVSHYRIVEKIGTGGMGVVYKAEDTKLRRHIALKFLPPHLTRDPEARKRFIGEARAASGLDHPNICIIHEIGETEDGQTYIVMAYYDGETVKDKIKRGRVRLQTAVDIAAHIARGLSKAHRMGIVHRDIKPANIMVTAEGLVKIMDFGLAKLAGETAVTQAGMTMGTVRYMAPEQLRGENVDPRADIWALGVVLYEMITAEPPFGGDTYQAVMHSILNEEPVPVRTVRGDVPFNLDLLVAKGLKKDPATRYQDADEILQALDKAKRELAVGAHDQTSAAAPQSSIAVLPFSNLSADPEQEYFCDGLTEEIINTLTNVENLRVVARTSSFMFKAGGWDIREVGRKLGVEALVEGSVRKAGKRLRITAQLVNVADGYHVWSAKYDRDADDIFAIQDDVALAIVDSLKVRLLGGERQQLVKRHTRSPRAHNLYLKGRYFLNQRTDATLKKSLECFGEAVEEDPTYAKAFVGLADTYLNLTDLYLIAPMEAYPKAKEAATRAMEIDGSLAEAHTSLAFLRMKLDLDWAGAERGLKKAIELNPGYAQAHHWYALLHMFHRRFDKAISEIKIALDLDPLSLIINRDIGQIHLFSRRYDDAIEALERSLEMDPHFPGTHGFMGMAYMLKSRYDRALEELDEEVRISRSWIQTVSGIRALTYTRMGDMARARGILEDMLTKAKEAYVSYYFIASIALAIGEEDKAFEWFWKAYDDRDSNLSYIVLGVGAERYRSDPRYLELVRKIGLPL